MLSDAGCDGVLGESCGENWAFGTEKELSRVVFKDAGGECWCVGELVGDGAVMG